MKSRVLELKRTVSELESYIYNNNKEEINRLTDKIKYIVGKIETINKGDNKKDYNELGKYGMKVITSIPFLYKPLTKKNYYEGTYLEKFAEQRTDDLKRAKVLDIHNKFWTSNNVERGNVFGSLPTELIDISSKNSLMTYGWNEVNVIIYEVDDNSSIYEISKMCDKFMENYLIVTEKGKGKILVLEYKI